jgi:glycine/sarcosine N-methyltransferase
MTPDLYEGFAERYDLTVGRWDEFDPAVARFFRRLFSENGVRTVLDCACGTGRHLQLFHSLGCQVWGSDVSESMLAQARKNLARYRVETPLRQADYRVPGRHRLHARRSGVPQGVWQHKGRPTRGGHTGSDNHPNR